MLMGRQRQLWLQACCVTCRAMLRSCLMEMRPTNGWTPSSLWSYSRRRLCATKPSFRRRQRPARKCSSIGFVSQSWVHADRDMLTVLRDETRLLILVIPSAAAVETKSRIWFTVKCTRCNAAIMSTATKISARAVHDYYYYDDDDDDTSTTTNRRDFER